MTHLHERCTRCSAIYTIDEIEDRTTCTFRETRYEPAEYECRCDCGCTELEPFHPCTECENAEPLDGTDICADCLTEIDPEAFEEYCDEFLA